jgi:hypothetical protein
VADRPCYKQAEFTTRIQQALGVDLGAVSCHIVDEDGMARVMGSAGWGRNDANGVVGFQLGQDVYVLDGAPWTTLHELVHRAGINADRLNRFVAEGLTEAVAERLRQSPDEHRPTYPREVAWIKERLLPSLGMDAIHLGRVIAQSSDPPRTLAALMAKAKPGTDEAALRAQLAPQKPDEPSFNRLARITRPYPRAQRDDRVALGAILTIAGMTLWLPSLLRGRA